MFLILLLFSITMTEAATIPGTLRRIKSHDSSDVRFVGSGNNVYNTYQAYLFNISNREGQFYPVREVNADDSGSYFVNGEQVSESEYLLAMAQQTYFKLPARRHRQLTDLALDLYRPEDRARLRTFLEKESNPRSGVCSIQ